MKMVVDRSLGIHDHGPGGGSNATVGFECVGVGLVTLVRMAENLHSKPLSVFLPARPRRRTVELPVP